MTRADVTDVQVLRDLRRRTAKFMQAMAVALTSSDSDVQRVHDWLHSDRLPYWRRQCREREEAYQLARRQWLDAEDQQRPGASRHAPNKTSSIEERVLMQRAQRRRDEAETQLAMVRTWLERIDHTCAPLRHQCRSYALTLHDMGGRALTQLDHLADQVDAYHSFHSPQQKGAP